MALFGGGVIRKLFGGGIGNVFKQKQEENPGEPVRNALRAGWERLVGAGDTKGILTSKGTGGGLMVMLTGLSIGTGFDFGTGITDIDGSDIVSISERVVGGVVALFGLVAYIGRNKASTPLAGSDVAERQGR